MIIRLARHRTACVEQPTDGATKFGGELEGMLRGADLAVELHDFSDALRPSAQLYARGGVLFSATGPYAYLYHYWRERLGGTAPIIRDIHGAAWIGYLAQEWLCDAMTRPGDVVVFPSEFARSLYARLFPRTAAIANMLVGHPMFLGSRLPPWRRTGAAGDVVRIGSISRLSRDKNILQLVGAAARSSHELGGRRVELHVIGGAYDLTWRDVEAAWLDAGGEPGSIKYWGYRLAQAKVDEFFRSIDVLAFFSTSNVEALGRVVVEARFWSVPVCMARHAAADELVAPGLQVPVDYFCAELSCADGSPMGRVDVQDGADALRRALADRRPPPLCEQTFLATPFARALLEALSGRTGARSEARERHCDFRVSMPAALSRFDALANVERLLPHLRSWAGAERDAGLGAELASASKDPARTERFLRNVALARINHADMSGYPYHVAALLDLHPTVNPRPTAAERPLATTG